MFCGPIPQKYYHGEKTDIAYGEKQVVRSLCFSGSQKKGYFVGWEVGIGRLWKLKDLENCGSQRSLVSVEPKEKFYKGYI